MARFDACWMIATMKAELPSPVMLILVARNALAGLLEVETMLCELCQSEDAYNFHHFIPRTLHTNKWFKRRYTRQEMQQGIEVCKSCHSAIHDLIPDEKELGRNYNTKKKTLRSANTPDGSESGDRPNRRSEGVEQTIRREKRFS